VAPPTPARSLTCATRLTKGSSTRVRMALS
jgi:hypothetical protein